MKEKDLFILRFAGELEETPKELISSGTVFRELDEWNSLLALSIISMIDEEYGILISGSDLKSVLTIEELFNLVKSRK